ncbi:MAG: phage portal protein [bacterium]
MSLFTRSRERRHANLPTEAHELVPSRLSSSPNLPVVTNDTAMRHSAVWACLRLRADLISTFPVDVYRRVPGLGLVNDQIEVAKPPVLVTPGGEQWDYQDWMYASNVDLDRAGNTVGLITERDGGGRPRRIDLSPISVVSVRQRAKDGAIKYRIDGKEYDPEQVWHERQYPVAGLPVGLSPVAYAAWTISEYMSLQQFALDWFGGGGVPKARLKNTAKVINDKESEHVKNRYRAAVSNGELFVHGRDWEYHMIQAQESGTEWLEGRKYGLSDIARFFGCPSDLIEATVSAGGSITYANVTNRHLQFLILNMAPLVARREKNLTKLLPAPRFVKLNTDALLRMDPRSRAQTIRTRIQSRTLTPNEARALDDLPPLTPRQIEEFNVLFGEPAGAGRE